MDYPGEDCFALILNSYLETEPASQGTVGSARSELIIVADLASFASDWMSEHLVG